MSEWDEKAPGLFEMPIIHGKCFMSVSIQPPGTWIFRLHFKSDNGWVVLLKGHAGSAHAAQLSCVEESELLLTDLFMNLTAVKQP